MGNSVNGRSRRVSNNNSTGGSKSSLASSTSTNFDSFTGVRGSTNSVNEICEPNSSSNNNKDAVKSNDKPAAPFAFRAMMMMPNHTMVVNVSELRRVLLRPDVRDKPVVVLSIAGLFRKGKSFMLSFLVRYLETHHNGNGSSSHLGLISKISHKQGWLNTESTKKHDFPRWKKEPFVPTVINGSNEVTTAAAARSDNTIFMWSKPYFRNVPGVGEVVILLIDGQASSFECPLTAKDCATVFAMTTMLSSVQIFNIQGGIDESDLHHLDMFIAYGRTVFSDLRTKPFQNLVFLIRDWSRPYDYAYGFEGGDRYLADLRLLGAPSRNHHDLERIWQRIDENFESVGCFLMPHPGTAVATAEKYTGPLRNIDATFVDSLRSFVPRLLSDDNLLLKTINSKPVTCGKLFEFLKIYAETLQSSGLPTIPESLIASAAHLQYWSIFDSAKTYYEEEMDKIIESMTKFVSIEDLTAEHEHLTAQAARILLSDTRLVADKQLHERYINRLAKFTARRFEHYVKLVESKNESFVGRSGSNHVVALVIAECSSYLKSSSGQMLAHLPSFVRNHRRLAAVANTIGVATMICLTLAIIFIIGLPVLVSVLVGGALFYFSKRT